MTIYCAPARSSLRAVTPMARNDDLDADWSGLDNLKPAIPAKNDADRRLRNQFSYAQSRNLPARGCRPVQL